MVDKADLDTAAMLSSELQQLEIALEILAEDGRIVSFTLMSALDRPPFPVVRSIMVQAYNMTYPPQMTDAIINLIHDRIEQIHADLAAFGVTGVDESPRR